MGIVIALNIDQEIHMLDTQDKLAGWEMCVREALEHLLVTHPGAVATLREWVDVETRKLDGLDMKSAFQMAVQFRFRDAANVPTEHQRGRHAALNLLAALGR
ncbi:hypothetical protein EFP19_04355 [Burkholderia glumae]|nr:hypothetical protein EFP19_04355 [Burkholderia glumae]